MIPNQQLNRRSLALSDEDVDRIERAFEKSMFRVFELIGYDITDPKERDAIRDDHKFVRNFRLGSMKAQVTVGMAAITAFVGAFLWVLWYGIKAALTAKGAP